MYKLAIYPNYILCRIELKNNLFICWCETRVRFSRYWLVRTVFGLQKPPFGLQKPKKHRNKRTLKTIIADFKNKSSDKNKKRSISSVGKSLLMRTLKTKGADFKNQKADFKNQKADFKNQQVGKFVIFHIPT